MLPQMKLSYIPQTGHLTLSVLGSVSDRILLSSTLGSTPHRGHALNSTSLKVTVLSHLVCDRSVNEVCKSRVCLILNLAAELAGHLDADCVCDHVE